MNNKTLSGQRALITGAGQGIGRAIALKLSEMGAKIVVNDVNESAGKETVRLIEEKGGAGFFSKFSVADYEQVQDEIKKISRELGGLEILVNNAGITRDQILPRMSSEDWLEVLSVNLTGAFNCARAVSRIMVKNHYGRIISLSSVVAFTGQAGQTNYSASKAGLIGLTRSLALELAPFQITVNAIAPGLIETEMTAKIPEEHKKQILSRIPIGRPGKPEEVAELVGFLSLPGSGYITGQVIHINGGLFFG